MRGIPSEQFPAILAFADFLKLQNLGAVITDKNPTDTQKQVFLHNEVAVCGVIKSGLLRGVNTEEEYRLDNNLLYFTFIVNFI